MGDWFQILVAPEVSAAQSKAEGVRMLAWLIAQGIVSPEKKDCVLGSPLGHPPGPNYVRATGESDPRFLSLRSSGLAIITAHTVFHSGQGGFKLVCSNCRSKFDPPDRWGDAVNEWFKGSGLGILKCTACGHERPIVEWQHDPPWAFGELGFEFWNWPRFIDGFVLEFERQLGSRIGYLCGKL